MTFDIWGMRDMHFAQAMQPIEKQVTDAFEIVRLENMLNDEIKCESRHVVTGPDACSIEVTDVVTMRCKSRDYRVCAVSAGAERVNIAVASSHKCGNLYCECVSVRPI